MNIRICKNCEESFNLLSNEKIRVGGYANVCPDCTEEEGGDLSPPRYLGMQSGDGKMSNVTILKFKNDQARAAYAKAWKNNSGFNKGKSCQLGNHLTSMSGMEVEVVAENRANANHKGKA